MEYFLRKLPSKYITIQLTYNKNNITICTSLLTSRKPKNQHLQGNFFAQIAQ
jgi:hypothetical protein